MKIVEHRNSKVFFFISGMFGGSWIWEETLKKFTTSDQILMQDPLCCIGNKIEIICNSIIEAIHSTASGKKVVLVGNSLGSLVGLEVARRAPHLIESVIISGAAGFGEVNLNFKLSPHKSEEVANYLVDLICFDEKKATPEAKKRTADSFRENTRNIARLMKESNQSSVKDVLEDVQCPVYAIWGEEDVITPYQEAKSVLDQHNIPTRLIPRCGHSPMYEKPDEFAGLVDACVSC